MISCLCVTHERHEFMPWVEHQFAKQTLYGIAELVIIDSSPEPWVPARDFRTRVIHAPQHPGIASKRSLAAMHAGEFFTWFDDDDWQSPTKLQLQAYFIDDNGNDNDIAAVGARKAQMYSTLTGKCAEYVSRYEPIIFNSAVYRKDFTPLCFNREKVTGEDTEWHERFFASNPDFITLGEPQHAWLCHNKNITNKASSRFFDQESRIPFDSWELDFLKRLHT